MRLMRSFRRLVSRSLTGRRTGQSPRLSDAELKAYRAQVRAECEALTPDQKRAEFQRVHEGVEASRTAAGLPTSAEPFPLPVSPTAPAPSRSDPGRQAAEKEGG